MACAAVFGAVLGWFQFKLLRLTIEKCKFWLIAIKLPMWALPMLAAVYLSTGALMSLVAAATVTYLGFAFIQWRGLRKGE